MSAPSSVRKNLYTLGGLIGWLALVFTTATVGAIASVEAAIFYEQLVRPVWAPPGWVFGPVWTVLYLMMGIAAWLVWKRSGFAGAGMVLILFCVQLAVNALWSWLFFSWKLGAIAFADTLLLWVLIVATSVFFWKQSRLAGLMLLPYLAWVTYASVLTYSVWRLNQDLLG